MASDSDSVKVDRPLVKTKLRIISKADENDPDNRSLHSMVVYQHCAIKGAQFGSLVALATGPLFFKLRGNAPGFIAQKTFNLCAYGAVAGSLASLALCYKILHNQPDVGVFDRAYRLSNNELQNRSDVASTAGFVMGGLLALRLPVAPFPAACAGIGFGVLAHCAYKPFAEREPLIPSQ